MESNFIRLGRTKYNLMGYALLMGSYITLISISTDKTPELMCYSQLISCVLAAVFVTVSLIVVLRKRGWSYEG